MFLASVAACAASVWYVSRMEALSIGDVRVEGVQTVAEARVRDAAEGALAGTYGGIIPRRFMPFYPDAEIRAAVGAISRVEGVDVMRDGRTLTISITEAVPSALWCAAPAAEGGEMHHCFFINEAGVAYEEAPTLRGMFVLRVVTDRAPEIGAELLEADLRRAVFGFADALRDVHGMPVARIMYDGQDVAFVLAGGGRIMASGRESFDTAYQNLASVLGSERFAHLQAGRFEYIDLRFDPKVFIREASVSVPEPDPDAEAATSTEIVIE